MLRRAAWGRLENAGEKEEAKGKGNNSQKNDKKDKKDKKDGKKPESKPSDKKR